MDVTLAPSLLAADFSRLGEQIASVNSAGVRWLHLDVMDGAFVPNISFGPPVIRRLRPLTSMVFDTHLMIQEPDRHLEAFRAAGADVITVHWEACPHLHRTVSRIRELGAKAGVSVNPATPVEVLRSVVRDVDLILVMSVNPGFGGQAFIPSSLEKIREARDLVASHGSAARIEVDGGIDASNIAACVRAGADTIVAGTSVFGKPDPGAAATQLMESVRTLTV